MEGENSNASFVRLAPQVCFLFNKQNDFLIVQDAYFAHLDHSGRRTDIQHRPELYLGFI
jgi:hypothetical protein